MRLRFDEEKATQAAARLLAHRGAPMSYMKLLKLLYMADRTALLRWGRPITMDHFVSMKHGPVLSNVYSLIVDEPSDTTSIWARYISPPERYEVSLRSAEVPADRLSMAEENLLDEIYHSYGSYERWALVKHLHGVLPEWKDPGETSVPITLRDILGVEFEDQADVEEIERELCALERADALLAAG